ncbi:ParB/Sulfiredoxin [Haematococcus lacustris]
MLLSNKLKAVTARNSSRSSPWQPVAPYATRSAAVRSRRTALCSTGTGDHAASSTSTTSTLPSQYSWTFDNSSQQGSSSSSRRSNQIIQDIPVAAIKRPLGKTRANDPAKVEALMQSIQDIGLQEPIDILEVDGQYYGFSGCHRFEAHQRLGRETIRCRVRKATREVLKMHLM